MVLRRRRFRARAVQRRAARLRGSDVRAGPHGRSRGARDAVGGHERAVVPADRVLQPACVQPPRGPAGAARDHAGRSRHAHRRRAARGRCRHIEHLDHPRRGPDGADRRRRGRHAPRGRPVEVGDLPLPLLAAGRDGRPHARQRLSPRRGDGEGGHLSHRPLRARFRVLTRVAADRHRTRRLHDAPRRIPGAPRDRPQAHPRLRNRQSARLPHRRPRIRHARRDPRRSRPAARARAVQVGAVLGRRHHRPPAVHPRHPRDQRTRTSDARARDGQHRHDRLDGRRDPDPRLRRQGGRADRAAARCPAGRPLRDHRAGRRHARLGVHGRLRHPLHLGSVLDQARRRGRRAHARRVAPPADRIRRRAGRAGRAHRRGGVRLPPPRRRTRPLRRHRAGGRPGSRRPRGDLPSRTVARARAGAVHLARHARPRRRGVLEHEAPTVGLADAAVQRAGCLQRRAPRRGTAVGGGHEPHAAGLAPDLRRHHLRRTGGR